MEMFISDTHLGHENILKECRPQFETVEEMDSLIIENINRKMNKNDVLYIVGDFTYRSKRSPISYLEEIRPKKILIAGNHDRDWLKRLTEEDIERNFLGVYQQYSIKKRGIEIHFNHFPQLAWNRSHYFAQSFSICGHIHNARDTSVAARLFPQVTCQFNAGVEVNNFEPVTFEELVANNTAFYGRIYSESEQALLEEAILRIMQ